MIIVLAFMVLLTGVVVAFFVRATNERQIADSSASRTKAELFARGAIDAIVGDLRQEIADGSTTTNVVTGSVTNTIFLPWVVNGGTNVWSNAVPALVGSTGTNGLQNLVKISTNAPFYRLMGPSGMVSGTNRASADSTTNASLNFRSISPARWNKPLLLPPNSATDYTPVSSAGFTPPTWVYVNRVGSNPTAWSNNMIYSTTNPTSVIGRYAYAIYDEGGLLDINAAGFPSALTNATGTWASSNYPAKISLSYADLTQLTDTNGAQLLTQAKIDQLVGWRNAASLVNTSSTTSTATNYANYACSLPNFLSAGNTTLLASGSDHPFATRQQLISYFAKQLGGSSSLPTIQSLQYFSTFTRSLNQPSLYWPTNIPIIVSGIGSSGANYTDYGGGNTDYGSDFQVNTNFLTARVTTNFTRNDGSVAQVGEPLVRKRFPLEYLAWITCKGPSAGRTLSDPDMAALLGNPGVTTNLIACGTAANIRNYFGLVWNATDNLWDYSPTGSSATPVVSPLSWLSDLTGSREPNFIELLKAGIKAGSLGKSIGQLNVRGGTETTNQNGIHQYYASTDDHIIQIAANIIEQAKPDAFPVRIRFTPDTNHTFLFSGSENLPYLYGWRNQSVQVSPPCDGTIPVGDPVLPSSMVGLDPNGNPTNMTGVPPVSFFYQDSFTNRCFKKAVTTSFYPGYSVLLINPQIWNPYDINTSSNAVAPTQLRVVADNTIAFAALFDGSSALGAAPPSLKVTINVGNAGVGSTPLTTFNLNPSNSALTFFNSATQFREPTLLITPGIPSGSGLSGVSNVASLMGNGTSTNGGTLLTNAGGVKLINPNGTIVDWRDPLANQFLGIMVGATPLTTKYALSVTNIATNGASVSTNITTNNYFIDSPGPGISTGTNNHWDQPRHHGFDMTFRVQYLDAGGVWRDYATYFRMANPDGWNPGWGCQAGSDNYKSTNMYYPTNAGAALLNNSGFATLYDPRTMRFGADDFAFPYIQNPSGVAITNALAGASINAKVGAMYNAFASSNNVLGTWHYGTNGFQLISTYGAAKPTNYITRFNTTLNIAPYYKNGFQGGGTGSQIDTYRYNTSLFLNRTDVKYSATVTYPCYTDPDGVIRRAMGAYVPVNSSGLLGTNTVGIPTFTSTAGWETATTTALAQSQSRPTILHRPFRSVAELGYVFRDIPWKNLDLFTPESGDTGLLDLFCIRDSSDQNALMAGKVNLNTRQPPVLRAVLSGSQTDQLLMSGTTAYGITNSQVLISPAEMTNIANALVSRTCTSPLSQIGDLVGRYQGASPAYPVNYTNYSGFSADLTNCYTNPANISIQRFHEAAIRSLANSGQTRVWNLLIDLIAQTGRYPASATSLQNFMVEGERRLWIHVAIDRFTGAVIDYQIEAVNE